MRNIRPINNIESDDYLLTHLETTNGGEVLWQELQAENLQNLQEFKFRRTAGQSSHDTSTACTSFIFRVMEASRDNLMHLESEKECPHDSALFKLERLRKLEVLRLRVHMQTGMNMNR